MIDYADALRIAREYVSAHNTTELDLVLLDEVIEKPIGWGFACNTRRCLEGDDDACLVGWGSFMVVRRDGTIFDLWSGDTMENGMDRYAAGLPPWDPPE